MSCARYDDTTGWAGPCLTAGSTCYCTFVDWQHFSQTYQNCAERSSGFPYKWARWRCSMQSPHFLSRLLTSRLDCIPTSKWRGRPCSTCEFPADVHLLLVDGFPLSAFRVVIPYPEERIPLAAYSHYWSLGISLFPMLYMAYLARRPHTYILRLMLLPIAVLAILGTFFHFKFPGVESSPSNWGLGILPALDYECATSY